MGSVRRIPTDGLTTDEIASIRELLWAAFADEDEGFTETDWEHALGGVHVVLEEAGGIVAHASVVERVLEIDGRPMRTGYVEAVATKPGLERRGHGSAVMREVNEIIRAEYELGALGTGALAFYERLGWERWRGPSFVRTPAGPVRTEEDDGWIMVLRTADSPLDLDAPISCDWRTGDVW
jgi:aminoglycoside 2'-N-acetyltransferase I